MKAATVSQLKKELVHRSSEELLDLCLRLSKFKKENKELLTYLLFEAADEAGYIQNVKNEVDTLFEEVNTQNYYWIKKSIRKILRNLKKYIRYSGKPETEAELLLYFCLKLKAFEPSVEKNRTLQNLLDRQFALLNKKLDIIHEDLQHDFRVQMEAAGL